MEKLKMHTPDFTDENIARLAELFPNCITESRNDKGELKRSIDFDQLKQELSGNIVEGPQERYHLDWPGKREALLTANAPIAKTLRPCREESVDFDTTKNLYIEGDNLDALKLLQETYLGKVKMIYIDPPYNTGADVLYEDDFAEDKDAYFERSMQKDEEGNRLVVNADSNGRFHSDWMTMMFQRLRLSRNLLSDDGMIFISIDEVEVTNLKLICDEIFGSKNFVEQIAWKNKYGSGALTKGFANVHEYILVYTKSTLHNVAAPLDNEQRAAYKLKDEKYSVRGGYITQPLGTTSKDERPNLQYTIKHNGHSIRPEKQWTWSEDRFLSAYANNEVVINERDGKFSVRVKQYLKDENGVERLGKPISVLNGPFNQEGTKEINELFGKPIFGFPKPVKLIQYLLSFVINDNTDTDYVILDFFSGSATAAHALMSLNEKDGGNRHFILVQFPEEVEEKSEAFKAGYKTIAEIGKERIRRAGKKIKEESGLMGVNLDIGFRVLKIDTSNMKDVYYSPDTAEQASLLDQIGNVEEDRTAEDLLFQVMLDWGVDLALPIERETIDGKDVFFVDGNAFAACFDDGINADLVKAIAERKPLRAIFKDNGYDRDDTKINVAEIFKLVSPETQLKAI